MKKILLISLLVSSPLLALTTTPTKPTTTKKVTTPKATLTAAKAKLEAAQAKLKVEAADVKKAAAAKAQAAIHLDKTKRSVSLGIQPVIDVVNQTNRSLTLYGVSATKTQVLTQLPGGTTPVQTVTIPAGVESIYVESASASTPVSLANGIQAIAVLQKSEFGALTYTLKPLIPQYGNHILIYNGSTTSQTARLTLDNSTVWTSVKAFFSASPSSPQQVNLIYTIEPDTTYTCVIPPFADATTLSPIAVSTAKFGIKNGDTPITIKTADHNTFVITPNGILVQSQNK
jgi:hypothetical protein